MKKKFLFLLFSIFILIGLAAGFSASADTCPTDNGQGVGCLDPSFPYYCGGQCRGSQSQCPTWTPSPICASGFSCTNFATADTCGYGSTCAGGYTRCGSWPSYNCTATISPVSPCNSYDTCNNYCTGCISGYALCSSSHTCVANPGCSPGQTFNACTASCEGTISMLKLGYDSVSGNSVIQSATYPTLYIPSSGFVGIGTTTPAALLHVATTNGIYGILAGAATTSPFRVGNVDDPSEDSDVATKLYVDSVTGVAQSAFWSLNGSNLFASSTSWNVGIGTSAPNTKLEVYGDHNTTKFMLNAQTGQASPNDSAHLSFWASEPGQTWNGAGIGNNINGSVFYGRINTARGASYIRLLDDAISLNTISSSGTDANNLYLASGGLVGIGTSTPTVGLEVTKNISEYTIKAGGYRIGDVGDPSLDTDAANKYYVDAVLLGTGGGGVGTGYLPLSGGTMHGAISFDPADNLLNGTAINLAGYDLIGVDKITVETIDPLYYLNGTNYATFVASIAGGVKEEYIGKAELYEKNRKTKEFEKVIDFDRLEEGSDLWVWRRVVDFSHNNVDAIITPYGQFAPVYYLIDDNKLIFRSDRPVEISYRLIGKRFDWRKWPTKATDQTVKGMEVVMPRK